MGLLVVALVSALFIGVISAQSLSLAFSTPLDGRVGDAEKCVSVHASQTSSIVCTASTTRTAALAVTSTAAQSLYGGDIDTFFVCGTPAAITYATYFGGSGPDWPSQVLGLGEGRVAMLGYTGSTDLPLVNPLQIYYNNLATPSNGSLANSDAYFTIVNSAGAAVFSTYFGGNNMDRFLSGAVSADGRYLYAVGFTSSLNILTVPDIGYRQSSGSTPDDDIMWTVWDCNLAVPKLIQSSYLWPNLAASAGGRTLGKDRINAAAISNSGNLIFLAGTTTSTNVPLVNPKTNLLPSGSSDAWIGAFVRDPLTGQIGATVYLQIIVNAVIDLANLSPYLDNSVCIGGTANTSIPILPGSYRTQPVGMDMFTLCFDGTGSLIFSTYVGSSSYDIARGIVVFSSNLAIAGFAGYSDWPSVGPVAVEAQGVTLIPGYNGVMAMFSITGNRITAGSYVRRSNATSGVSSIAAAAGGSQLFFCGYDFGYKAQTPMPGAYTAYPGGNGFLTAFSTVPPTTPSSTTASSTPTTTVPLVTETTTAPQTTTPPPGETTTVPQETTTAPADTVTEPPIDGTPPPTSQVDPNAQQNTTAPGVQGQVNVQGNITVQNLPITVSNVTSFGSVNASGCVNLAGNLSLQVSQDQLNSLDGSPLTIVTSGNGCIQGNFTSVTAVVSTNGTQSKCISLSADAVYTSSAMSVLITSRDRCKKDKFPVWAGGLIAAIVVLLAVGIAVTLFILFRKGYFRSWWAPTQDDYDKASLQSRF